MFDWSIDPFPLKTAAPTPGQMAADKWLRENPGEELRPVDSNAVRRLIEEDRHTQHSGIQPTPSREHGYPEWDEPRSTGYHMPGINDFLDDDDDELERRPTNYHVVTGPVDSDNPSEWTEHPYVMFEHPDSDYDPQSAWDFFQEDHPEYDGNRNAFATHEVKDVHPEENHELWHNNLSSEQQDYERASQHGFEREAPRIPGHRTYTHTDPYGGTHRLWHNDTTFVDQGVHHGPGWRVSYHQPDVEHEDQVPMSLHDDASVSNSLDRAIDRANRNKRHADVLHSGTGLGVVENMYGNHYVSRRPNGSMQQLLRNHGYSDAPNWGVTWYPADETNRNYQTTEHGDDFAGALEQARRNLARG